jgi:hypothetical protein
MGWTKDNLLGIVPPGEDSPPFGKDNEQPRDDATIERFFQSWLYFGTAIEFFKVGGDMFLRLSPSSFCCRYQSPERPKRSIQIQGVIQIAEQCFMLLLPVIKVKGHLQLGTRVPTK